MIFNQHSVTVYLIVQCLTTPLLLYFLNSLFTAALCEAGVIELYLYKGPHTPRGSTFDFCFVNQLKFLFSYGYSEFVHILLVFFNTHTSESRPSRIALRYVTIQYSYIICIMDKINIYISETISSPYSVRHTHPVLVSILPETEAILLTVHDLTTYGKKFPKPRTMEMQCNSSRPESLDLDVD